MAVICDGQSERLQTAIRPLPVDQDVGAVGMAVTQAVSGHVENPFGSVAN